ncbi:MAG: helix-turn-helix domain-containing protein [Novosphingobium sp.]|uniref:helix-turn-helix domain-containing protein n=1 Tax=Novosphingobium sp. TaxID=1874826 RepID=UPI002734E609|nr:helix-turn-helix domain-containing protein [Novosphingobium sp.]MDP3550485.1 helix-turn-helix domain-containing protein [Novosphingobium sp.]
MVTNAIIPLFEQRTDDDDTLRDPDRGIPIRAISRAIAVLQAINRSGSLTMTNIAKGSCVPYPTACRIVQTLIHEGLIEREPDRKHYRPTALVQTLSHGFQGDGELIRVARPYMAALTREVGWPLSLCTHVGSTMVLRDSTHGLTSLTFNHYHPGFTMPMLACGAGLVHLAYCSDQEREIILEHIRLFEEDDTRHMLELVRDGGLLETVRRSGHAARGYNRFTRNPGKTSSIAVPLLKGGGIVGTLTLAFFSSSIEMNEAIRQLLPRLKACAATIGTTIEAGSNDVFVTDA